MGGIEATHLGLEDQANLDGSKPIQLMRLVMSKLYIKRVSDGLIRPSAWQDVDSEFWWLEGNGSCDCNRRIVFGHDTDDDQCVSERYLIVAAEPLLEGYTLTDFNEGYPQLEEPK